MDATRVGALLDDRKFDLRLTLVAGKKGLSRKISSSRIQKPGLVLAGFMEYLHKERLQVFGNTEMSYLTTMPPERAQEVLRQFFAQDIACLVVTKGIGVPPALAATAEEAGVPVLQTTHLSSTFIESVQNYLEEILAAQASMHGVLLDVFGVGILLLGKSGIGKSEIALDLVMRGHRLVADDIVDVKRMAPESVYGTGSEIIKHHMEVRGLGIINIKDLFGVAAIRERKKIEIVLELVEWDPNVEYDRLGVEEKKFRILDVEIPMLIVPVRPGRNMTTIIEVAARNHLLKLQGHHSAKEFQERLNRAIALAPGARGGELDVE
ncbi:HPr(Ser) kinase/phosphatase [Anaeromyxobacter diazotrophicus]|uniref:HPr kinase/phosphorylase n=1 Tax=Anaeromyxobacter diazotrophicus TaxID=2590199 RepID=A0A7I9VRR9_9BACT|nr:HPr(Ser) kinase/phosphatase [Anaeromyxobacter diazotrophicus]GEJ58627.1 HPr kinase/phosphorylase [Anaeromyxobacter diazotrophicus]